MYDRLSKSVLYQIVAPFKKMHLYWISDWVFLGQGELIKKIKQKALL